MAPIIFPYICSVVIVAGIGLYHSHDPYGKWIFSELKPSLGCNDINARAQKTTSPRPWPTVTKENSAPRTNSGVNTQSNTINLTWADLSQSKGLVHIPLDILLVFNVLYRLRRILELVKTVSARVILSKEIPEDLVCDNSKIVLVGDAAHPFLVNKA